MYSLKMVNMIVMSKNWNALWNEIEVQPGVTSFLKK